MKKFSLAVATFLLALGANYSTLAQATNVGVQSSTAKLDTLGYPDDRQNNQHLSIEARLFYSTLIGRPFGMASEDLYFAKLPKNLSYAGFSIAAAARQALRIPDGGLINSRARLEEFLSGTTGPFAIQDLPKDMPAGMRADDLAMLHIYALVMSDQAEATVQLLEKYLGSKNDFTRHFVIMALRSIGTAKARELIKSRINDSADSVMARDALGMVVPNLSEPRMYAAEVPVTRRFRENLLAQAKTAGTASILPTFLLTFVGEDSNPAQLAAEKDFLMNLYKTADNALWRKYMYGYAALAYRFKVPYEHWLEMAKSDNDAHRRSFILRSMAMQYPDRFHKDALTLFEKEKNGAVQVEFFSLYSSLITGEQSFGPYDAIWMPNLRYRLKYPYIKDIRKARSNKALFALWAQGRIPEDTHWPVWMADLMHAENERDFMRGYLQMKTHSSYSAYALRQVKDRNMLPVIKYLIKHETQADVKKATQDVYNELMGNDKQADCCTDESCLFELVRMKTLNEINISSENTAKKYLTQLSNRKMSVEFLDDLHRSARIKGSGKQGQVWEHWLGCWRPAGEHVASPKPE
ncbi:MAG: HEAT repeat domain-containing protein [Undibacterium umbellatum]|uniref:HEAT repeat domain-containing protein n=1 Tax=Undibacterium umbellatum TaxID=2762300 RepID=UPI003BB7009A